MDLLAAMLADAADVHSGKLYVHGGGWDSLVAADFPSVHPSLAVVLLLSAGAREAPGTGELRVQLVDEDGNDTGVGAAAGIGFGQGPLHRPGQRSIAPIAIPFVGIPFEKPGGYEFRVFWNGELLTPSISFQVAPPPATPSFGPTSTVPPQL